MAWSNLETNFQDGEATQALITADESVERSAKTSAPPNVVTSASGESLAVVIDYDLHIFGAKGKETEFSLHLKTPVVALTWMEIPSIEEQSAAFLFCSTSDGQLFVYTDRIKKLIPFHSLSNLLKCGIYDSDDKENAPSDRIAGGGDSCDSGGVKFLQFIAPPARPAPDEENEQQRKSSPDLAYRLMVLTGDCRCFLLSNLLLTDIFKALLCGNMSQVLKLKNQLVVEEETIGNEGSRLHDVAYSPRRRSLLISKSNGDRHSCLSLRFPKSKPTVIVKDNINMPQVVTRLRWSQSAKFFFTLEAGSCGSRLIRHCSRTCIALDVILESRELIRDFIFLNEDDSASPAQIAALFPPSCDSEKAVGNSSIEIRAFPNFALSSCSNASSFTHFIRQENAKDLIFVEAVRREIDASGVEEFVPICDKSTPNALRICNLSSLRPENFLQSLLRKHKFEAALSWASEKGLDPQLVHENEALFNLRKAVSSEKDTKSAIFEDVKKWCANVDDVSNIARFCLTLPFESETLSAKVLQYCLRRLEKRKESDSSLRLELEFHLRRLFAFIFARDKDRESVDDWIHWKKFVKAKDLVETMIMPLVKTSSFSVLLRLWRSLVTEAESCVVSRPSAVEHIIFSVEDTNGEYRSLCLWLTEDFIPFLAAKLPASIPIVCSWLLDRAQSMEYSSSTSSSSWPLDAISLLECGVGCGEFVRRYFPDDCSSSIAVVDQAMKGVKALLVDLKEIRSLRTKYSMNLGYHEYAATKFTENRSITLACMMLRRLPSANLIPIAVQKGAVGNFLRDWNLNRDSVFMEYLKELSVEDKTFIDANACEERATTVLSLVNNPGVKISALISALQLATLPWKPVISSLVEECLRLQHPLVESLKKNIAMVELRDRLEPYGLDRRVESALKHESKTIKLILSQASNSSSSLQHLGDACAVADTARGGVPHSRIYLWYLHNLLRLGRPSAIGDALAGLKKEKKLELAVEIAEKLINEPLLDAAKSPSVVNEVAYKEWNLVHVEAALEAIQFLKNNVTSAADLRRYNQLHVGLSSLKWMLKAGFDAKLRDCGRGTSLPFFRKCISQIENPATERAKVEQLAAILGQPRIVGLFCLSESVLSRNGVAACLPFLDCMMEELKMRPVQPPDFLFIDHSITGDPKSEESSSSNPAAEPSGHGIVNAGSSVNGCLNMKGSVFTFAFQFITQLRLNADSEDAAVEIQRHLSHLTRFIQLILLRAPIGQLDRLEELHSRLRLISDCMDHVICVEESDSFSASKDDVCSKEEEDAMSTALFPEIAKHLGAPIGFSVDVEILPDFLDYMLASAHDLQFSLIKKIVDALCSASLSDLAIRFLFDAKSLLDLSASSSTLQHPKQVVDNQAAIFDSYRNRLFRDYAKSLVNSGCVDNLDALTTLLEMPKEGSEKLLMELAQAAVKSQSYKRLGVIAVLSEDISHVERSPSNTSRAEKLRLDASWGYRLAKIGVKDFKECVYKDNFRKINLLEELIQNNEKLTSRIILDFCNDYLTNDSPDFYLLKFLTKTLDDYQNAASTFSSPSSSSSTTSSTSSSKLPADSPEFSKFISKATEVVSLIKDRRNAYNWASDQLIQAFPYDYPLLAFLYSMAMETASQCGMEREVVKLTKRINVLDLLMDYVRVSTPTPEELSSISASSSSFSLMIHRRLPFQLLFQEETLLPILDGEVTSETHALWLTLSTQFSYSPDSVTKLAVNNEVRRYLDGGSDSQTAVKKSIAASSSASSSSASSSSSPSQWIKPLPPSDLEFIKRLESLISKLTSNEFVVSVLEVDVLGRISDGSLKVAILGYVMQKFCQQMGDKITKSARERRSVIKEESWANQYRRLATIEILHIGEIVTEELVAVADQPEALVRAIYRIYGSPKMKRDSGQIHDLVLQVMEVWELKEEVHDRWKDSLIEEWIPSVSVSACDLDQTVSSSMIVHQRKATEEEEDEDNLQRAVFLLSTDEDDSTVCRRLHKIYISGDRTHKCQHRVIACLLALVTDSNKLKEHFGFGREGIQKRSLSHQHLTILDQLNFKSTVEKFDSKDKQLMAQMLIQKYKHNEEAVRLARNLCIEYNIDGVSVWKDLLKQIMTSSKDSDLLLSTFQCLLHNPTLIQVLESPELKIVRESLIQLLVLRPIAEFSPPLSPDQVKHFAQIMKIVSSYPLAHEMDVDEMLRRCLRGGFVAGAYVIASLFSLDSTEKIRKIDNLRQKYPGLQESVNEFREELAAGGFHLLF